VKLLLDENLSPRLAQTLQSHFPDSAHVQDCGLGASSDDSIWKFAKDNAFVIVSKDSDFHDLSVFRGSPPKVVWLRVGNCPTSQIQSLLERARTALEAFLDSGDTVLIVRPQ
jgi:predicted nuclease of predicted toxin-antitoxin system